MLLQAHLAGHRSLHQCTHRVGINPTGQLVISSYCCTTSKTAILLATCMASVEQVNVAGADGLISVSWTPQRANCLPITVGDRGSATAGVKSGLRPDPHQGTRSIASGASPEHPRGQLLPSTVCDRESATAGVGPDCGQTPRQGTRSIAQPSRQASY